MIGAWLAVALLGTLGTQDLGAHSEPIEAVEQYGPYFVFFGFDSSSIDRDGSAILTQVIKDFAASGASSITLTGHTDRSGASAYNRRLSERRVKAVALVSSWSMCQSSRPARTMSSRVFMCVAGVA